LCVKNRFQILCLVYLIVISGNAGDSLAFHNNMQFTTKDQDNDAVSTKNCAETYAGAWWYNRCHTTNLNGLYLKGVTNEYAKGVVWLHWKGHSYSLKRTIRPIDY